MSTPSGIVTIAAAFITGIFGPIIVQYLIRRFDRKKDPLSDAFILGEKISEKLEEMQEEYGADRMYILQFHNGGHYYPTGKSIQKFSMFYEVVKDSRFSVRNSFQNIPVHLFSKSLKQLASEDSIAIPNYDDVTVATYGLKYIAEESGTKATYLFTIKNIDHKLIGVLGLDYNKPTPLSDDLQTQLLVEAASIGGELSKYLKK